MENEDGRKERKVKNRPSIEKRRKYRILQVIIIITVIEY